MDNIVFEKKETISAESSFATVGEVTDTGITLILDGQTEPTAKEYKCNTSCPFKAGDRVKVFKDSGTYVVEYIVGTPYADIG